MNDTSDVYEVTEADFDTRVLEASRDRPVLVDFWAGWCAPCQVLMPILAKLAQEYRGKLAVAKVNSDEQSALATRYGVRSLPTVKLFRDGAVVDEFMGALPEGAVRTFLDRHVERESDQVRAAALRTYAEGDREGALEALRAARASDPDNERVLRDLLSLLVESDALDEARALIAGLPANRREEADMKAISARIDFALVAGAAPDEDTLKRLVAEDPGNCEARYQLAARAVVDGGYEAALEQLLEILRRDRRFRDDAGRRSMLAVFELMGGHGAVVNRYRSLMSSALY